MLVRLTGKVGNSRGLLGQSPRERSRLLHLQRHMTPVECAAFVERNLSQGNVIIRQGADLGGARGSQVALQSLYFKARAFAAFQLLLFGAQSGFGVNPCFARGIDSLKTGACGGNGILDLNQNPLLDLL